LYKDDRKKLFFNLERIDTATSARAGWIETAHGKIQTPIFMPVGTQGSVKAISPADLNDIGAQIILGNTYHLYLRPGMELVARVGGLQRFNAWYKPILTDSGGFQIFSLAKLNKVTEAGMKFQSHIDGSYHFFSPELVVQIQRQLGSDIMMVLDQCIGYPCEPEQARQANEITVQWARRCHQEFNRSNPVHGYEQYLFAIVQGSVFTDIRRQSAIALMEDDFPGFAIGGLSVGESKAAMYDMTAVCTEILPKTKPRYLMGVGKPEDLVTGISLGVDMFDCVLPTRNGRNGTVFTPDGALVIKNAKYREDFSPVDKNCDCYCCRTFTRAYLRHLFQAQEILALRLASLHNLTFYLKLMREARQAIIEGNFANWQRAFLSRYQSINETDGGTGDF
jgi:queuine tRNA-ribosyltransferase